MKKHKILIVCVVGVVIYYFLFTQLNFRIPCLFHTLTGFYCPGCGITRMFVSLLKLDFYQAFRYNPLVFILLILYGLYRVVNLKWHIYITNKLIYFLLFIVIVYGILRNIEVFSYLRPTIVH